MRVPIYIMSRRVRKLWRSIEKKAKAGYDEWYNSKYNSDKYWCPPWTQDLTRAEDFILQKIHQKVYGKHWYVPDPLGWTQMNFVMYSNLKYRVI